MSLVRDVFLTNVTRDIPPVVYFHEQSPQKLSDEVSEYIVTGGWPDDHPNHRRVPNGIHEQFVRLLSAIADELDQRGGPTLPNAWISGFYGSGKSSFAKLLGMALDGVSLPDGRSVAEGLLARDTSPRAAEFRTAWDRLRRKVDPIAVVFDVGSAARNSEHVHSVVLRQVQLRLGYCSTSVHVANAELDLERAGRWAQLDEASQAAFGKPWSAFRDDALAQARFSKLMKQLHPDVFTSDADWHMRVAGAAGSLGADTSVKALMHMLDARAPKATLFVVVDEVSQYVLADSDRVERLRAFAENLGAILKGRAWLLALGQQKLEEQSEASFLVRTMDRFPPKLRVHLAPTNIRDVVHKRLLQKRDDALPTVRALFEDNRAALRLYAYGCDTVTPDEFAEVYPLLPGHIDLLLQITTALRVRSSRSQGDDQAIRGLLQLLGELFRGQKLADRPLGALITFEQIYEVQHSALDADVQGSMARILNACSEDETGMLVRVAKVVALLETVQETIPTNARLVAQCLYDRVDRGNQQAAVTTALEALRARNLLAYSEKLGYKIQSSAGEEWDRERRDIAASREVLSEIVKEALKYLVASPERPRLQGRPFPWEARFSDGRREADSVVADVRDESAFVVDFRMLVQEERSETTWIRKSGESPIENRLVWVATDSDEVDLWCRDYHRSRQMVRSYEQREQSIDATRKILLLQEKTRMEDLLREKVYPRVAAAFFEGRMYFRGRVIPPSDHGNAFGTALTAAANRVLPDIFPHFTSTNVAPAELLQLLLPDLAGISPKFVSELGILELESGRFQPTCAGVVPRRVQERLEKDGGLTGTTLLGIFAAPPYGYPSGVVKACVAGLLRGMRITVQPEGGTEITATRDAGVRDLFERDRDFRRAMFLPAEDDKELTFQERARVCKFFQDELNHDMDRQDDLIADAVAKDFPPLAARLREVLTRLGQLPDRPAAPAPLVALQNALEACVAKARWARPAAKEVKRHLDTLRDGARLLVLYDADLSAEAIASVREAASVRDHQLAQFANAEASFPELEAAANALRTQLSAERPWVDIAAVRPYLALIRVVYARVRRELLAILGAKVDEARAQVRARPGFTTLTSDQSHQVLRPFALVVPTTTDDAIAPSIDELRRSFPGRLSEAQTTANDALDEILAERVQVVKTDLRLKHREVSTETEVEALVAEVRTSLLEHVRAGKRVRIL